jgi:hypothetical protein
MGLAIVLASCGGRVHSGTRAPTSWTKSTVHGDSLTVSFTHPRSWRSQLQPLSIHYSATFGFLSNFVLQQFCHFGQSGEACTWADLGRYPSNGVLMTLGTYGCGPGPRSQQELLGAGNPMTIDGHVAHRFTANGQGCLGTGAEYSVSYRVLDGKAEGIFGIEFCYRGSNPGTFQSEADRVARTLHIRPGPSGLGAQPD